MSEEKDEVQVDVNLFGWGIYGPKFCNHFKTTIIKIRSLEEGKEGRSFQLAGEEGLDLMAILKVGRRGDICITIR